MIKCFVCERDLTVVTGIRGDTRIQYIQPCPCQMVELPQSERKTWSIDIENAVYQSLTGNYAPMTLLLDKIMALQRNA